VRNTTDEHYLLVATLPPSQGQIRQALCVIVVLLAAFAVTAPFTNTQLPRVDAFIPVLGTAIVFNDLITAALLFGQFYILRWWALLVLANGYLFTALIIIPHALTFPGAFAPTGLLGAGLQSTAWLYYFWHAGSPLAVIAYVLLKDVGNKTGMSQRSAVAIIGWSIALVFAMVCVLTWVAIAGDQLLPKIFVDSVQTNQSRSLLFGGLVASLNVVTLALLWLRRRSVLDLWLMVMCCAWLAETTITAFLTTRFSVGFYASRIYAFVAVISVLLILLSETLTLYANLAQSAMRRRSNREGRQVAMDAMAASIAHEVKQPITAMTFNSDAGLEFLAETPPNINKARAAFEAIANDGIRAGTVVASLRAMFKRDIHRRTRFNVNDLLQEVLNLIEIDLRAQRISVSTDLRSGLPLLLADRIQLQQVFLNLTMNAIDAMRSVTDRARILRIRSEFIQVPPGIRITIEDTGTGIDSNDKDHIFEPFFTTKSTGTGIGLAICRSIVDSHSGQLHASANHPYGTIFQVALPEGGF
jgi:signal transduction histidine kinase